MPRTRRGPAAGQRDVDRLGDQHLAVTFGLQLVLAFPQRLAEPAAGRAHPPSRFGAGLGWQRADFPAGQR